MNRGGKEEREKRRKRGIRKMGKQKSVT